MLVEPRGAGLLMSTLHSAEAVRPAEFTTRANGEIDADMVAIAETRGARSQDRQTIIERKLARFGAQKPRSRNGQVRSRRTVSAGSSDRRLLRYSLRSVGATVLASGSCSRAAAAAIKGRAYSTSAATRASSRG